MIRLAKEPIFGFETKAVNSSYRWNQNNNRKGICSLIACVPLGNIYIGVANFFAAAEESGGRKAQRVLRGIAHLLFLTPLVLLIDAIVTGILNIRPRGSQNPMELPYSMEISSTADSMSFNPSEPISMHNA